jgi:CheY-like chemotaxis protein
MVANAAGCLTVLVVDDYADTRQLLKRMLEEMAFRVMEAADGQQAIDVVREECPNLILLDLNMPHVDGLEAARQIRACKGVCSNTPIVAITAFDTYGMEEAALEAGCDGYFLKPVDMERLDEILRKYLSIK